MSDHITRVFRYAALLAVPFNVVAEDATLPSVVVEAEAIEQEHGTVELNPQSFGANNDNANVLKRVPGADAVSLGPLTGLAHYRGMSGDRVNVSTGGFAIKEAGPDGMSPPLSLIPSHLTHGVKVYRGIAPVKAGIETFGGAVSADPMTGHFAEGDDIESHGNSMMGYTTVNSGWAGSLMASVANRNHRVQLSGSREEGGDYEFEGNRAVRPTSYFRDAYGVGYGYRSDYGDDLGLDYMDHATGPTGTPSLPMDILFIRGGVSSINYTKDLGDGLKLITSLHYQKMRHGMDNFTLRSPNMVWGDDGTGVPLTMHMTHFSTTSVEAGGERIALQMPLYDGELQFGFDGDQARHDMTIDNSMPAEGNNRPDPARSWQIENFNNVAKDRYSIFADWEGAIGGRTRLALGLRYTYVMSTAGRVHDTMADPGTVFFDPVFNAPLIQLQDEFNASKRSFSANNVDIAAVFTHSLTDELDLELGLARKNRSPNYQELFLWLPDHSTAGLADGKVYIGNQNLRSETAYQLELGADWHTSKFHLTPRAFYHYVDDFIQGLPVTDPRVINAANVAMAWNKGSKNVGVLEFSNVVAQLYGADLEGGYAFTDHWHLDGNLSYVRGQRLDVEDNLYRISPLHGSLQLSYHRERWMTALETVAYAPQGDVARFNDEVKTPGFVLLNLRGEYEPIDGLKFQAGIENLLDKENKNHLAGLNQVIGNRDLPVNARIPGRGQNFYVTVGYSW